MIAPALTAETSEPAAGSTAAVSRLLGRSGAWLLFLGLVTGLFAGGAMSGLMPFFDGRTMLSAHLAALMGAFYVFAVAWSLPLLRFGPAGRLRLAWAVIVPNFANWFITALKSALFVHGIGLDADPRNNAVFGVLTVVVVIPSLVAAGAWAWGFGRAQA